MSNTKSNFANTDNLLTFDIARQRNTYFCSVEVSHTEPYVMLFPSILLVKFQLTGEYTKESFFHLWHNKYAQEE